MRNAIHDEFMAAIQDTASKVWGVTIGDLSVDNIHVVNQSLAEDLKTRAVTAIKVDTQRQNAEAQQATQILQAETEARAAKYTAQAQQSRVLAEAEAEAQKQVVASKAEAAQIRAEGEARAERIKLQMQYDMEVAKAKA